MTKTINYLVDVQGLSEEEARECKFSDLSEYEKNDCKAYNFNNNID